MTSSFTPSMASHAATAAAVAAASLHDGIGLEAACIYPAPHRACMATLLMLMAGAAAATPS